MLGAHRHPAEEGGSGTKNPLKSVGDPDHLAAMAALLLTDEGSWITGQVIKIDGGMSAIR
jgi:3-oxoacyl-[acyl-carrier protein] reductase